MQRSRTVGEGASLCGVMILLVLTASGGVATAQGQVTKLLPDSFSSSQTFGTSVGISGNIAIIGANGDRDTPNGSGAAYLFDTTLGQQLMKLTPDDNHSSDRYGHAVAISGNTAVVGAWGSDGEDDSAGAVYLFDATTGQQLYKLGPGEDSRLSGRFGISVAISGNRVVAGAERPGGGSAYLFDATTGQQLFKFQREDAVGSLIDFGQSVAIDGDTVIVGGPRKNGGRGSAYVFDAKTGQQLFQLMPEDDLFGAFGVSVGISDGITIVGAQHDTTNGSRSGAAYLFDSTTGQQLHKLLPDDGVADDLFGVSVATNGRYALVGAMVDDGIGLKRGSAYLFDVFTGEQLLKLGPTEPGLSGFNNFGNAMAMLGNTAIIGASQEGNGATASGSAYVFEDLPEPTTSTCFALGLLASCCRRNSTRLDHRP